MTNVALGWRAHILLNLRLAAPLIVGQLATIGIWTSDVVAMGQLDSTSLAAGSIASRYFQPMFFLALGISLAVGPLVAQGLGAGDERQVRRAFRQGMVIAVTLGLLTVPLLFIGEDVLVMIGQSPELARLGQPFLFWSSFGMPFMFLAFVLRQFLISYERPIPQVIALILTLGVNIGLNEVFSKGLGPFPEMGLAGIALATSISYFLLAAGLAIYIGTTAPFADGKPFQRLWVMDWAVTFRLLRIGVPIGLTIVAEAGMFITATLLIGMFGTASLSAAAIANQLSAIAFMIPIAMATAGTIRVGHYAGAKDRINLFRSASATMIIAILGTTLILLIWPETLVGLFLDNDDPLFADVILVATPLMLLTALYQIPDGIQAVAISVLRGVNDTRLPGLIAIGSFWLPGIGLGVLLGFGLDQGAVGVWTGIAVGLTVAAGLLTLRLVMALQRIRNGGTILSG
jgi:MATE family multidrug resistance protein